MSQARRHRLFRARQQSAHKKLARRSLFEQLEARQLMASDLSNLHLIEDTQTPADLITSDSRLAGTVTFSNAAYVTVEFDDNSDGTPESSRSLTSSGQSFNYDPQWHDISLRDGTYGGAYMGSPMQVDFQMRLKEFDANNTLLATSGWQSFDFTLQLDGQPQLRLTDSIDYTTVGHNETLAFGQQNIGETGVRNLYLQNYGYGRVTIDTGSVVLPAGFTLDACAPHRNVCLRVEVIEWSNGLRQRVEGGCYERGREAARYPRGDTWASVASGSNASGRGQWFEASRRGI